MDESILFPSPNWFQVSGLAVSTDGWIIYGGPSKSLCVLEPLASNHDAVLQGSQSYKAHVENKVHAEKITSVDISPEWPAKREVLTGSADGVVKQWQIDYEENIFRMKTKFSHEIHKNDKEETAGVGYSNEVYAITVGTFGNIVKWDLNANAVKTYNQFLKNFKPTCMSCSRFIPLNVAVGTKQGVVFVLDLTGNGKTIYNVRGQDEEITNVSWCPQFEVIVRKSLKEFERKSFAADRMEKMRLGAEQKVTEVLDDSGVGKNLPDDSFEDSVVVPEDDIFDIYTDHAADEFGHKKYQPEDILVKIPVEKEENDFLVECMKLKEKILQKKNEPEPTIDTLVEALDKTHVDSQNESSTSNVDKETKTVVDATAHAHKHLLATLGKYGSLRIWSKSGKLVGTCAIPSSSGKNQRNKSPNCPTLLWYKPDLVILADGKGQLLECNPLKIDFKNKLEWSLVHTLHKRALYCIASDAPRVQTPEILNEKSNEWSVWTVSQERNIVRYSMQERKVKSIHNSCGGFLYCIQICPYDAGKIAISVGDGAVRVWETNISNEDETKLDPGHVTMYWQNVQGKVLYVAWHPTKENLLAFSTAESRVGLIDTSGKAEKPARVLLSALRGGVYSLCWGEGYDLYACGGGDVVMYQANKINDAPAPIKVTVEGQKWEVCSLHWNANGLLVGSNAGAVAALQHRTYDVLAVAFVFDKMIYAMDWHPQQTTNSNDESPYKNLIAVCSLDKQNNIVILSYEDKEGGGKRLQTWKTLSGHKNTVLHLAWNPHTDGILLSTSQDTTVRIWDICSGACTGIFGAHGGSALGGAWSAWPQLPGAVLSGGADATLRLWTTEHYPADTYTETKDEVKKKKSKKDTKKKAAERVPEELASSDETTAVPTVEIKSKGPKKFILPITYKQMNPCSVLAPKLMLQKYLEKRGENTALKAEDVGLDFLKLFGNINEVNEVLDIELEHHNEYGNAESWVMLSLFRGHIDALVQYANEKNFLCPFLVSIAPCVSVKYWKDVNQMYIAQIDRLVAKGEEGKLYENRYYGGAVFRKAACLLSAHDAKAAVDLLRQARLYKEAYVLCRIRYMDSIAEETLLQWANECLTYGTWCLAAVCYLALGDLAQAATALGKSNDQECLSLAADIAKVAGRHAFVNRIEEKKAQIQPTETKLEKDLVDLPTRIQLLMSEGKQNGDAKEVPIEGGENLVKNEL